MHTTKGPIRFTKGPENLYYCKPKYCTQHLGTSMVTTIDKNRSFFTDQQVEQAKRVHALLHTLGCPAVKDLKAIIQMNSIQNCTVTSSDIDLAEKIFGKEIASIKGKTMSEKLTPVVSNIVDIPLS